MNESINILTVNPSEKPVGAMYPELGLSRVRTRFHAEGTTLARERSGRQLRMWFGATGMKPAASVAMLSLRLIAAALLVTFVFPAMPGVMGVTALVAAFSLVFGFGTRVICGLAAIMFGLAVCSDLSLDILPMYSAPAALVLALISRVGPGRFSADSILRRSLFRAIKRRETRRLLENRFSYRAFQYAHQGR